MTCIVGIETPTRVYIGGDSAFDDIERGGTHTLLAPKVFKIGQAVIGYAGNGRYGQLLRHRVRWPTKWPEPQELDRFMATDIADSIWSAIEADGLESGDDEQTPCFALIGVRSSLYLVEPDMMVWRSREKYAAIGSGAPVARGSLFSSSGQPPRRLALALRAAEAHAQGVRGPFSYVNT
jgi:hypothetical protein